MLQKLLQNAGLVQFQHHKEPSKSLPKPKCCELKVGAQVLLSFNLDVPGGLVNGSRGVVIGFSKTNSERKKEGEFLKNSDSEERFSTRTPEMICILMRRCQSLNLQMEELLKCHIKNLHWNKMVLKPTYGE